MNVSGNPSKAGLWSPSWQSACFHNKSKIFNILLGLLFFLVAILAMGSKAPLDGVHWDSPIYLYQGKCFAETPFLANYALHARDVAMQVPGNWPEDEFYSEAYWHFARLGHIVILGSLVGIHGTNVRSLDIVTWVYRIFQALALTFTLILVILLAELMSGDIPRAVIVGSATFTGLLYLCSDVWRYLSGNLVSEIPALFLLTGAALMLVKALKFRSHLLAAGSGVAAFLLYVVRMESIVPWLAFLCFLALTLRMTSTGPAWWWGLVISLAASFLLYVGYAWWFYPLADPQLFYQFMKHLGGGQQGEPTYKLVVAVGGSLWIGVIIALVCLRNSMWLSFAWLLLGVLPLMPSIAWGLYCQTRMMLFIVPPLLLVSTMGWTVLFDRCARRNQPGGAVLGALCAVVLTIAVSWSGGKDSVDTYFDRGFLNGVRSFLMVPSYEKARYPVDELAVLSKAIHTESISTVVSWSLVTPQEYINLIRYFGPSHPPDANVVLLGDPANRRSCDLRVPWFPSEPVSYCNQLSKATLLKFRGDNRRILRLRPSFDVGEAMPSSADMEWVPLLQTAHFQLSTLAYGATSEERLSTDP